MISLYQRKELKIRPEFQRFFRWTPGQKSRFIESLLLGIPIPPIFVSQDDKGKWDVIDGLQRLSTILQLTGDLLKEDDTPHAPLILTTTNYLPSLDGKRWATDPAGGPDELSESAKLLIKRSRLDLKIVLNSSGPLSKFELFDRLNTGGSSATDQEVRNCILIMVDKTFFDWFFELGKDENYKACLPLTERQLQEQYDLELAARFLAFRDLDVVEIQKITDLGSFLTRRSVQLAQSPNFDRAKELEAFRKTFKILAEILGEDSFRKFDIAKAKVTGAPLISVFETMALGIGFNCLKPNFTITPEQLRQVHREIWKNPDFTSHTGSGIRSTSRLPVTIPLGRGLFEP
jgi:hypothetical protein